MKKIIVTGCLVWASLAGKAQQTEGRIVYERVTQMQIRLAGMDGMENILPRTRTDKVEVLFGNNQSLRRQLPEETPDENAFNGNGMQVRVMVAGADDITYHNFSQKRLVEQREFAAKKYIINDSIRTMNWKLTGESKTILGLPCQQAIAQQFSTRMSINMVNGEMKREEVADTLNIVAWFATAMPVPAGPDYQGQLPGLIMEIDVNNGRTVYKAIEVSPKVEVSAIKEPKQGKKVTAQEFRKEREKIMEEMQRNGGGRRVFRAG